MFRVLDSNILEELVVVCSRSVGFGGHRVGVIRAIGM